MQPPGIRQAFVTSLLGSALLAACSTSGSYVPPSPYAITSLDEACDSGPTPRQVLDSVKSPYAGTYTSEPRPPGVPPWTGPTAPSALSLTATYTGGKIICTPVSRGSCPNNAPCAVALRQPTLSLELDLTFKTADGVFDEHFVGTVTSGDGALSPSLSADLPATAIRGSYPVSAGARADVHLSFGAQFAGVNLSNGIISEMTSTSSYGGGVFSGMSGTGASDAGSGSDASDASDAADATTD
jgi:hypothetical protein